VSTTIEQFEQRVKELEQAAYELGIGRDFLLNAVDKHAIQMALERNHGHQERAAHDLHVHRNTLLRDVKRYEIEIKKTWPWKRNVGRPADLSGRMAQSLGLNPRAVKLRRLADITTPTALQCAVNDAERFRRHGDQT